MRIEGIRCVVGGPRFRLTYPNGDIVGYVPTIFDARVVDGTPHPDGDETVEVGWFTAEQLGKARLTEFTDVLFEEAGVASHTAR